MKKEENFSEWYNAVVEENNLTDKRYPVKGLNVWPPYGWKAMLLIDSKVRQEFDSRGHDEVNFPLLIPEDQFQKEKDHIKGFDSQVYWVTKAGDNELDIKLLLRPTSETAMYPLFSTWIRSHADLPLRVYQIVNTFRYETKQTRAFIRVREIHFIEGHTCHATFQEAEGQIAEDLDIMRGIARALCLPFRIHTRPEWDKFPGAYYTKAIDTVLPDGRTLQIASIHQYRNNFSIPYDIYFEDEDGQRRPVFQTTYGLSERMLGAVVAVHGDDKGLIFPPPIAPIQVVVVPVLKKGESEIIDKAAAEVAARLVAAGIRTRLDSRDIRPGNKYYEWEGKGVPLRLEVGKREATDKFVTAVRRDSGKKQSIGTASLEKDVSELLDSIRENMLRIATEREKAAEHRVANLKEIGPGLNIIWWCGNETCGKTIDEKTGSSILGIPEWKTSGSGRCIVCANETEIEAVVSKPM